MSIQRQPCDKLLDFTDKSEFISREESVVILLNTNVFILLHNHSLVGWWINDKSVKNEVLLFLFSEGL